MRHWQTSTALAGFGACFFAAGAQAAEVNPDELLNLSLEQLSNIEVTSVSKRSEKASEAAAAIFVITQDDIRRSGATSIPEVLRVVPGLNVAQSGAHQWAITARGFNDQFANKLLVLIDGRSVYTPLFSGVYWDTQDTPLQDIERIEVIRGPGATLWGANAVNGVINIITKNAKNTQGALVSASAGTLMRSLNTVRYGAKINDDTYVRTYAQHNEYESFKTSTGGSAQDNWKKNQGGFRVDGKLGGNQTYTLQGDVYRASENGVTTLPLNSAPYSAVYRPRDVDIGGNILGRWDNKLAEDSNLTLQMYYNNEQRDSIVLENSLHTLDFDLQHTWAPRKHHEIVWGGGYRFVYSDSEQTSYFNFIPLHRRDNLFSFFAQDKVTILPDEVFLTLGSKFEHNGYTGFEYQPSARLSWLVDSQQTLWASVSRAVHTPDVGITESQFLISPVGVSTFLARVGNPALDSEEMVAYEIGYRIQPSKTTSFDASLFYNDYSRLILGVQGSPILGLTAPGFGTYNIVPISPVNAGTAHSWGGELLAKWNPVSSWELAAGYSLLQLKFDQSDPFGFSFAGKAPQQQLNLRSAVQLPHDLEWSAAAYMVDDLRASSTPGYMRFDTRLAWKPVESMEVSIVGQNLLDDRHKEFGAFLYQNVSQIPRSVYGNITWKF